ncbi:immunity 26 domain-containing protein [Shewanella marisflavi]|uniref:Imm26 family immunity protein n=1 Tax=Shewanella marisflavi TaxID=260364 RepID=UPI00200BA2CE|nr:Imm26 family immunity protein [Shewanella marisflavi]MCL1043712.1 immunity 26 domain-containing protein [Shewanella marisflavi]
MARKKVKFDVGDVFLVPLENDAGYGVGTVIEVTPDALNSVLCGFYNIYLASKEDFNVDDVTENKVISLQFTTPDLLKEGVWEVLKKVEPLEANDYFDFDSLKSNGYIGAEIEGSAIIRKFLSAFHGVHPWNCYFKDDYFDEMMLDPHNKPDCIYFIEK